MKNPEATRSTCNWWSRSMSRVRWIMTKGSLRVADMSRPFAVRNHPSDPARFSWPHRPDIRRMVGSGRSDRGIAVDGPTAAQARTPLPIGSSERLCNGCGAPRFPAPLCSLQACSRRAGIVRAAGPSTSQATAQTMLARRSRSRGTPSSKRNHDQWLADRPRSPRGRDREFD